MAGSKGGPVPWPHPLGLSVWGVSHGFWVPGGVAGGAKTTVCAPSSCAGGLSQLRGLGMLWMCGTGSARLVPASAVAPVGPDPVNSLHKCRRVRPLLLLELPG